MLIKYNDLIYMLKGMKIGNKIIRTNYQNYSKLT